MEKRRLGGNQYGTSFIFAHVRSIRCRAAAATNDAVPQKRNERGSR
jgi:hypothetical protein